MINLSNEIKTMVFAVFTGEATEEGMRRLKELCHAQDEHGRLFSKLSDREWIRANLVLFDKFDLPRAKEEVWQRIQSIMPPEGPVKK